MNPFAISPKKYTRVATAKNLKLRETTDARTKILKLISKAPPESVNSL